MTAYIIKAVPVEAEGGSIGKKAPRDIHFLLYTWCLVKL